MISQSLRKESQGSKSKSSQFVITLSILTLFAWALANYFVYLQWDFDDSYIVYRIVKNILAGNGWVYNIGEAHNPSTSVLNTILITLIAYWVQDIPLTAHIVDSIAIWGAGVIAYLLFRSRFGNGIALFTGCLIIQTMSSNLTWGLEINLFIGAILLFILLETQNRDTWLWLPIVILIRPDGLLLAALKWLKSFIHESKLSIKGLCKMLAVLSPWIIFSLIQFNQAIPDTLSQKVWQGKSGLWGTGPIYLKGFIEHYLIASSFSLKVLVIGAVVGTILMWRHRHQLLLFLLFGLIQQVVYVVLNVPPYGWYFALLDTAVLLAAMYAVGEFLTMARKRFISRCLPLEQPSHKVTRLLSISLPIFLLALSPFMGQQAQNNLILDQRQVQYTAVIKQIDQLYGPGRLATSEVGFIGFSTDRTIIDIVGLTSAAGHFATMERMDAFYQNPPNLLLLHAPPWSYEKAIYADYRFPFFYKKEATFPDPIVAMQLYVLQGNQDWQVMRNKLIDIYPIFQPDERFDQSQTPPLSDGKVFIDSINGSSVKRNKHIVHQRDLLNVQGWAVDLYNQTAPIDIFVLLVNKNDGQTYVLKADRFTRQDVANYLKDQNFVHSGFRLEGLTLNLPAGIYRLDIVQGDPEAYYYSETSIKIEILHSNH